MRFRRFRFRRRPGPVDVQITGRPQALVSAQTVANLRTSLASDATFRARWQTAVTSFLESGGYWATLSASTATADPLNITFASFLTCVRRSDNDLGLTWGSPTVSWQTMYDRCVAKAVAVATANDPNEWSAICGSAVYDFLYNDLPDNTRSILRSYITSRANAFGYCLSRWDDQSSSNHVAKVVCSLASDTAAARFADILANSQDWAEAREWIAMQSLAYEWKQAYPANYGQAFCLWLLKNHGNLSDEDTIDKVVYHHQHAWQHVRQFTIPHPGMVRPFQCRTNMLESHSRSYVDLNVGTNMLWGRFLSQGKINLDATSDSRAIADGPIADVSLLANNEDDYWSYWKSAWEESTFSFGYSDVTNPKWIHEGSADNDEGHTPAFFAWIPWLVGNVQIPSTSKTPVEAGIPLVRRWWPGTADLTTIRSGHTLSNSSDSLITYSHQRYFISGYEGRTADNGEWQVHRAGPLLVKRGAASHGTMTRAATWGANGCITFIDDGLYEEFGGEDGIRDINLDVADGGGGRLGGGGNNETRAAAESKGDAADMGQVTAWHADADCVALTSDLTRTYNSTLYALSDPGNEAKISSFVREFVCVRRGGDGTQHEKVFTYDRIVLTDTKFEPRYNLCPVYNPDIDGTETARTPSAPTAGIWTASGPTAWDYAAPTRMIVTNTVEPGNSSEQTTLGTGKAVVTWLTPSGASVKATKRGGHNASITSVLAPDYVTAANRSPYFDPWGQWIGHDGDWSTADHITRRAYSGPYTVEVAPTTVSLDTRFVMVCEVMPAVDSAATTATLTSDANSHAVQCGASAVVWSKETGTHTTGDVDIPSGVALVVLTNLTPDAGVTLTGSGGLSVDSPGRVASQAGVLAVEVSGAGNLAFSESAVVMSHNMGIGGVTDDSATYRARTSDTDATIAIEYSTSSSLAGSTTSAGVAVTSASDYTGGETITGLSANTTYYYSILVNGTRAHTSPYPSFKTFPAEGVDATVKFVVGSCQTTPVESQIYAAMDAEAPTVVLHLGDFGYPDSTVLATQRSNYKTQYDDNWQTSIVNKYARAHVWDDHDYATNNSAGNATNKGNSLQAFKEFIPTYTLANPTNGIWHSFAVANVEVFMLDTRYQREGSIARYPNTGPDTYVLAQSGTSLDTIVLPVSPSDNQAAITTGWYCEVVGRGIERVSSYNAQTRTVTLANAITGLASGDSVYLKRASILDENGIASNQVEWLLNGLTTSTKRWKVLATSVIWNPTALGDDIWGEWDEERIEQRYLIQELAGVDNIIVLSGDRHFSAIDDGTNSVWPEMTASPFNNDPLAALGSWSHGSYSAGHSYGTVTFSATSAVLTIKDATGGVPVAVTSRTVPAA